MIHAILVAKLDAVPEAVSRIVSVNLRNYLPLCLHSEAVRDGSTHKPAFASRASVSSFSSSAFPGAYFRDHHHQPFLTSS